VVAIGGIGAANAADALAAGAAGVAVIREVMAATDPGEAVRRLLAACG
jgi:thiamine-phosphate pyrophosphorylase